MLCLQYLKQIVCLTVMFLSKWLSKLTFFKEIKATLSFDTVHPKYKISDIFIILKKCQILHSCWLANSFLFNFLTKFKIKHLNP